MPKLKVGCQASNRHVENSTRRFRLPDTDFFDALEDIERELSFIEEQTKKTDEILTASLREYLDSICKADKYAARDFFDPERSIPDVDPDLAIRFLISRS